MQATSSRGAPPEARAKTTPLHDKDIDRVTGTRLIEIVLLSAPRVHRRWLVPTVVTLLLGWWAFPWGPVHTIRGALQNVRGGRTSTVEELLAALSAPAAPRAAWWRRLLALDTGDTVQIAANIAIAVVFLALVVLILLAVVAAHWSGSGVPPP